MSNVPPPSQAPQPPFPGPHHPEAACLLTFMVVFPVEGQGVALGVLFPLLLSQVGVGVVIAEPRPVLIPFPTDWRAEQAGRASQPSQPMPPPPWPPGSYLPLCQRPEHPPNRVWNRRGAGRRGQVSGAHSLSPSSEGLTITDIRLVSVLQRSGVLAFPETSDAICLREESGVRDQEREGTDRGFIIWA